MGGLHVIVGGVAEDAVVPPPGVIITTSAPLQVKQQPLAQLVVLRPPPRLACHDARFPLLRLDPRPRLPSRPSFLGRHFALIRPSKGALLPPTTGPLLLGLGPGC